MKQNREFCIKETLKHEGGYTNHPSDPGGPTNFGITIHDVRKYWKKDATAADVKAMPISVAIDIYTTKYWKTPYYDCDKLESGVDFSVYDFGVNSGPARAKKYLEQSVGGPAQETIKKLCAKRLAFLQGLKTWSVFGKGWGRRVKEVEATSLKLASQPSTAKGKTSIVAVIMAYIATAVYNPEFWVWFAIGGVAIGLIAWLYFRGKKNV